MPAPRRSRVRLVALALAALGVAGVTVTLALRPVTGAGRRARRRPREESLTAVVAFCDHGGAVAASPLPSTRRLDALASRVDTAAGRTAGSHLPWLGSDLAAAVRAATAGHPRREADDLYAAVGAVAGTPLEHCITPGRRP